MSNDLCLVDSGIIVDERRLSSAGIVPATSSQQEVSPAKNIPRSPSPDDVLTSWKQTGTPRLR